jgi:MFS family permease
MGFLMIGGIQTILANTGNFFAAVCAPVEVGGMGFEVNKFSWWITCYAFGMALSQLYVGRLWLIVKTPILLGVSYSVSIIALALMGTYQEMWQWYVSGALIGLSGGVYFMVGGPIIITNWFAKSSGFALGVMTIIGAAGAAILSPVHAMIIAAVGWRTAYFIVAAISLAVALPWVFLVIRYSPDEKGLKPIGWTEGMETITAGDEDARGTSVRNGVLSIAFVGIFLGAGLCALFGGFQNLWALAAESWGYGAAFGSYMISATALFGLMAPLLGIMIDKLGAFPSVFIVLAGQIISALGLIFLHSNAAALLICVFFFADQMTVVGVLCPLITRLTFGPKNYTKILAYIQIGIGLIGGFSAPIVSTFFTTFGAFEAALWFGVALAATCAVLFFIVMISKNRLKWED